MLSVSIVGVGRMGGALTLALSERKFRVESLVHRDPRTAIQIRSRIVPEPRLISFDNLVDLDSDVVMICTADRHIAAAVDRLAGTISNRAVVFHTSGALSSEILWPLRPLGCSTGSIHPLISISDPLAAEDQFAGANFCIEGDERAAIVAAEIAEALGGRAFTIETPFKPLYHAAAVTASGHLTALLDAATEMLAKCGIESENAKTLLLPLVDSTIANLHRQSTAQALTGTFARADLTTLELHLAALNKSVARNELDIFLDLGERSLQIALRNGVNKTDIDQMRGRILIAKESGR